MGGFFRLGLCYRDGDGANQDRLTAACWFVQAAQQGHAEAAYEAAISYRSGVDGGLTKPNQDSAVYFQRDGAVTSKCASAAYDFFHVAAQQEHVRSQFELGRCYQEGMGVSVNKADAKLWFQRASDQGHIEAMLNLLAGGYPLEPAERYAMSLAAAQHGLPAGQYELALCYRDSIGVERDPFAANLWFQRASSQVS